MAGHSHSANIKHKKAHADKKRGKLFGKLSRAIIIAARNGGGDPDMNLPLRYAIDKAREVSMPKDNIERAIKRGTGDTEGENYEEIAYEGYGAGGVAILAETLTDNRNRTSGEIRKIFEKGGGKMGNSGCVAYLFDRKGLFTVDASKYDEETIMDRALEAGADDVKRMDDVYEITCDATMFAEVKAELAKSGTETTMAEITQLPQVPVEAESLESGLKVLRLLSNLDDHDDVQNVYSNLDITDEIAAAMDEE